MNLLDSIVTQSAQITAIRRDIHAHPELCFEENRTAYMVMALARGETLDAVFGFLVNLPWARARYFAQLAEQTRGIAGVDRGTTFRVLDVAGQVVAEVGQAQQQRVVVPLSWVGRQRQRRAMLPCPGAPEKTLGAQVCQWVGQTVVPAIAAFRGRGPGR